MQKRQGFGIVLTLLLLSINIRAADIQVVPGIGTLADAVANASDGDTLILQDGGYQGAVTVDKSLIIRAAGRSTDAVLASELTIDGIDIEVTLQGLILDAPLVILQAAAVNVLENWILRSNSWAAYNTSHGDGSLVVVGNQFDGALGDIRIEGAYIAGNTFHSSGSALYDISASVWIVGNDISASQRAIEVESATTTRIIGNRISCVYSAHITCLDITSSLGIVANNVILVDGQGTTGASLGGVYISGHGKIINNVISGTETLISAPAIFLGGSGRIMGNIIINHYSDDPVISAGVTVLTENNLCFNTSSGCPDGDGNLNVNPHFIDEESFRLAAHSPAIDAGPSDYGFADLDRTRNDMGAYGGPWSIGQYDAQREPSNLAPYVYPLFKGDAAYSGGALELQAIGVARLR